MNSTIRLSNEDRAALGMKDTVHDYEVIVESDSEFTAVIDVRLTFDASENVGQTSDRALAEARKRAIKLAKRDFGNLVGNANLNVTDVEWQGSALVNPGQRPRRRK